MMLERDSRGRIFDAEFTRRHAELTPAIRLGVANPGVKLLPTRTGLPLPDDELRHTELYREVMAVQGWRHAVAVCFWTDPPGSFPVLVFSVKRPEGQPDFSDRDLASLAVIHGFMEPAVLRYYERATAESLSEALAAPLRHAAPGLVVVNSRLQIVRANHSALALFHKKGSVRTTVLHLCRQMKDERIELMRPDLITKVRPRRYERSIIDERAGPMRITMFCHDADGISEPTFVVEIDRLLAGSSNQKLTVSASILGRMTAAERDVALALAAGHSNQEIADYLARPFPP